MRGEILDISITHGEASSDWIAFETSYLYSFFIGEIMKVVLFGDNAYLDSSFLATPYPNVRSGSCDDYNHYHSQVSVIPFCITLLQYCIMKLIQ